MGNEHFTDLLLTLTLNFLFSFDEATGDHLDLQRLCRHIMNKAAGRRLISKQECMVLLGRMDLAKCTQTIENVSISNATRLNIHNNSTAYDTMLSKYMKRSEKYESYSLYEFYHHIKNKGEKGKKDATIPNFVGVSGRPTYPINVPYAKHTLIVHQPWREYPTSENWIGDFNQFINSVECPVSAKLTYNRVVNRWMTKMSGYDPKSEFCDHSKNPIDCNDKELLDLLGLTKNQTDTYDETLMANLHKGIDFQWDKKPQVRMNTHYM